MTIGLRIKQIRNDKDLSLQDIAGKSGLSKSFLSKVENFRTIPSLPVLLKIADVLNVNITELVKDINKKRKLSYVVVRKNERKVIAREKAKGFRYELLITENTKSLLFESFVLTLEKDARRKSVSTDGDEFLFILKGKIEFEYGGEKIVLGKGDSVFFDGRIPHLPKNIGRGETKILVVYLLRGR